MKTQTNATDCGQLGDRLRRAAAVCLLALAALWCQAQEARAQWTPPDAQGNISNTNPGNVGVGTATPTALLDLRVAGGDVVSRLSNAGAAGGALDLRYKYESQQHRIGLSDANSNWLFYTQFAPSNTDSFGYFPGRVGIGASSPQVKLAVGGAGTNVYATDAWIENNMHVQGNEVLTQGGGRGRLRVGTAWGYMGIYAETSSTAGVNDLVLGAGSGNVRVGPNAAVGAPPMNFIVPNGNVGVGTSAPGFRFDVQGGQLNASGGLCIAGDCKTSWSQIGSQWATSGTNISYGTGNVGIGTASPTALLDLRVAGGDVVSRLSNAGGVGGALDLRYKYESQQHRVGLSDGNGNWLFYTQFAPSNANSVGFFPGKVGVGTTDPATALHVVGDITVTGNINAKYQDVAEWVPSSQKLLPGTVVVLDPERANHVLASAASYDTSVAGVVSERPGLALGEAGEGKALVATTGRVKVRVDATKAPVRIGDLLVTSDMPGVAMKSEPALVGGRRIHAPGTIIGKALEPLAGGTGEILVLLSLQ